MTSYSEYDKDGNEVRHWIGDTKVTAPKIREPKPPTNGWDALQTFFGCAGIVAILLIICYFGAKIWINA